MKKIKHKNRKIQVKIKFMYVSYEKVLNGDLFQKNYLPPPNCLSTEISRVVNTKLTGISSTPKSQAIIKRGVYARRLVREAEEDIEKRQQKLVWEGSFFTVPHSYKIHPLPLYLSSIHSTGGLQGTSANSRKCFSSGLAHHVSNEGSYSATAFATYHLWPTVLGRS